MESLNTLANSLPNANSLANSEKDLLNNFKAAALSITTLYRSSRQTSKRAYNAGYGAACQDLLLMIQQGVSAGGDANPLSGSMSEVMGNGMTIGKVMDWIEARLEAIKTREEEEDEEEEKERVKSGAQASTSTSKPSGVAKSRPPESASSAARHKEQLAPPPSTPPTPPTATLRNLPLPSSTTTSPLHVTRPMHHIPATRASKSRVAFPASAPSDIFKFGVDGITGGGPGGDAGYGIDLLGVGAGAKRRHAVMMMLDSAPSPLDFANDADFSVGSASHPSAHPLCTGPGTTGTTSSGRRRTRSTRSNHSHSHTQGNGNQHISEAMDVEEEGRERKRVTRR